VLLNVAIPDISGVHAWAVMNVLEINRPNGLGSEYEKRTIEENLSSSCGCGAAVMKGETPRLPNIILVLIESLSTYHTRLLSGKNSMMPRFDAISEKGTAYRNFFSNGYNTNGGLVALFTGLPPLPPTKTGTRGKIGGFNGYFGIENALPRRLGKMGYFTVFTTAGDLTFSHKDEWLLSIGFDQLIGHDHSYYEDMQRYQFSSVPDRALYENIAYNVLPSLPESRPWFLVIESVSTHHPFHEPGTGSKYEEDVFGYADEQFGWFFEQLEGEGVLENSLLIITSDHRAMTPIRQDETVLYGEEAPARIPLAILGQTFAPGAKVDAYLQQSDLMESIIYFTGRDASFSDFRGNLLATPPVPSKYIIHYGSCEKDGVQVFSEAGSFPVRLDGEDTGFRREPPADGAEVIDLVNCIRIQASERVR
jgi:phosphoglycerol transferase MdoB-like AlkP superfamily enzyme